ncbi:MAG: hypothetical protein IKZ28_06110 [Clostridia bacterium]|nr:hypothetical protein [Clostridia bacterium]
MWIWLTELYEGESTLMVVGALATCSLVLAACVSWIMKDTAVYGSLSCIFGGTLGFIVVYGECSLLAGVVTLCFLLAFGGMVYLVLGGLLFARKRILERKRLRAEIARRVQFTLPERENVYVRTRLNTTLKMEENGMNAEGEKENTQKRSAKLAYARTLLNKLKESPLTMAERLQTAEMEKIIAVYYDKGRWSAEELRSVNELCAALLKLSAKYAV